jgi:hypothetical protein
MAKARGFLRKTIASKRSFRSWSAFPFPSPKADSPLSADSVEKLSDEDCRTISTKQRFNRGRKIESLMRPQTLARPDIASKIDVRSFSTE